MPEPRWQQVRLRCKCGHTWQDWQPIEVTIYRWIGYMTAVRCPVCGNDYDNLFLLLDGVRSTNVIAPTPRASRGRQHNDEWVTKTEALALLPYYQSGTFEKLVKEGLLTIHRLPGTRVRLFSRSEVNGLIGKHPEA